MPNRWYNRDVVDAVLRQLPELAVTEGEAPVLPRECYVLPDFFAFEKEAVFARTWVCVGRVEQIPEAGNRLDVTIADEPLFVIRGEDGTVRVLSAVCRHRGQVMSWNTGPSPLRLRCPLHFWTYDLNGRLIGAPRMGDGEALARLRVATHLPRVKSEIWHGFIFINLDGEAEPLAPSLSKLEPFWTGYEDANLVVVPPVQAAKPLPWNWKIQLENFTDAYHPEFVHRGTHDFAPSVHAVGQVEFAPMAGGDNAIVRTVPLLSSDGGMTRDGWGPDAMFPPIETLSAAQRGRLALAIVPPTLYMIFAPGAISYTLLQPVAVDATLASSDRVTGGGWLLPRTTVDLADFEQRAAAVREGAGKIWAQDVPVNLALQAGKRSRLLSDANYGPLETTLRQFNAWLVHAYRAAVSSSRLGAVHDC